jgi:hypothetical protein
VDQLFQRYHLYIKLFGKYNGGVFKDVLNKSRFFMYPQCCVIARKLRNPEIVDAATILDCFAALATTGYGGQIENLDLFSASLNLSMQFQFLI